MDNEPLWIIDDISHTVCGTVHKALCVCVCVCVCVCGGGLLLEDTLSCYYEVTLHYKNSSLNLHYWKNVWGAIK